MTKNIFESLRTFTGNLFDYAGLFPPAGLKLSEAFKNYIEYKNGNYKWMLSNFICPVKLLPELENLIEEKYSNESEISLSVLGRGGHDADDFKINFEGDLDLWKCFDAKFANKIKTDFFETRFPDDLISGRDINKISGLIDFMTSKFNSELSHPVYLFLECFTGPDWKKNIKSFINSIELHNENSANTGFKLRTGGVEAYAFPPVDFIALSIRECLDRKVPMKFTAGLHHPFRHYDNNIKTMMHGFVNVFAAGIIAARHNISNKGIKEILNDENPGNFIFDDNGFSWKDWKVDIKDIKFARENLVTSYGTCSIDEPIHDLKSINLL